MFQFPLAPVTQGQINIPVKTQETTLSIKTFSLTSSVVTSYTMSARPFVMFFKKPYTIFQLKMCVNFETVLIFFLNTNLYTEEIDVALNKSVYL